MGDYISRNAAIDILATMQGSCTSKAALVQNSKIWKQIKNLPSADVVNKTDLLGWLLAYHTKSFELKGRYMPHEVIGWLINDLTKNFIGERGEQNG